uniref:RE26062p n=1 Tax=Drosophila melanogaster TaxID=7227 RepID=Q8SYZ9_DROME|nr:RE26062p [Drosophila melanogaster]
MAELLFPQLERPLPSLPSLHYTLFAYREELRRRDAPFMKMSTIKLHLTDNLILQTIKNIRQYDTIEIMNLNQEIKLQAAADQTNEEGAQTGEARLAHRSPETQRGRQMALKSD